LIQERLVAVCAAIDAKDIEAIEKEYDSDVLVFPGPPASGAALHGLAEFRPLIDGTTK
jgi:ketosteroid isomerase-like protein